MNKLPNIALVGNAPADAYDILNNMLAEEDLTDLCSITLYGADGQPESEALHDAIDDFRKEDVQGIVCLPMRVSFTEAIKQHTDSDSATLTTIITNSVCRLSTVKGDISISETAETLNIEDIKQKAENLAKVLKRDLGIQNPRIAVLSLNDEIATNETSEEANIITPAITELVSKGIQVFGPMPSGTFLDNNDYMSYDAILAMYDSQRIDKFTELTDDTPVTIVSGTDIPATSSEAEGILHAIFTVLDIIRNRHEYDIPFANPLQKLYHERKEGNDKSRFTIKKKGFNPAEHRRENVTYITKKNDKNESNKQHTASEQKGNKAN